MINYKISICIPVYNVKPFIEECLLSLVNQTYKNTEIIVVDDKSTDGSYDILMHYKKKYDNLIVLRNSANIGTLATRCKAIDIATGDWILFVDSDDYLTNRNSIENAVKHIQSDDDIIEFNKSFYDNGKIFSEQQAPLTILGSSNILFSCFVKEEMMWMLSSKLFRASILKQINCKIQNIYLTCAEDAFHSFAIFLESNKYRRVKDTSIYTYRLGVGISTKKIRLESFLNSHIKELDIPDIIDEYVRKNKYAISSYDTILTALRRRLLITAIHRSNTLRCDERDIAHNAILNTKTRGLNDLFMRIARPNVKILLAYHKPAYLLKTGVYTPIHVGRAVSKEESKDGFPCLKELSEFNRNLIGDNTGDNVSEKNRTLNELTALYWAWKNYKEIGDPDYFGLCHYRRFFIFDKSLPLPNKLWLPNGSTYCFNSFTEIEEYIDENTLYDLLNSYDCIVPKPYDDSLFSPEKNTMRKSYITHGKGELNPALYDLMEQLVLRKHPEYSEEIEFYRHSSLHYFCNMFIFPRDLFFEYCNFLFPIIFEIDKANVSPVNLEGARAPGYIGEYLTSIFITRKIKEGKYRFNELDTIFVENTDLKDYTSHLSEENIRHLMVSDLKKISSGKLWRAFLKSSARSIKNRFDKRRS